MPPERALWPTPDLIRPSYSKKTVTLPRHPCPGRAPSEPHERPISSPRLLNFSPPIRLQTAISPPVLYCTHIRAIIAHVRCGLQTRPRDRPRGAETLPPIGTMPQASVRASLVGALWRRKPATGPCPTLSRGVTLLPRIAHAGITELRRTAGAPSYEYNRMSQKLTDFAPTHSKGSRCEATRWRCGQRARPAGWNRARFVLSSVATTMEVRPTW